MAKGYISTVWSCYGTDTTDSRTINFNVFILLNGWIYLRVLV